MHQGNGYFLEHEPTQAGAHKSKGKLVAEVFLEC